MTWVARPGLPVERVSQRTLRKESPRFCTWALKWSSQSPKMGSGQVLYATPFRQHLPPS